MYTEPVTDRWTRQGTKKMPIPDKVSSKLYPYILFVYNYVDWNYLDIADYTVDKGDCIIIMDPIKKKLC